MQSVREADDTEIAAAFRRNARLRGPKYLSLYQAIAEAVESGEFAPGAQLPPEDRLARTLGLSIGTVRKAMQTLTEDGVLTRRQGAGTFVTDPSLEMHDVWHFCFLGDDGTTFLPLSARAKRIERIQKDGPWRTFMPDAKSFIMIQRVIDVGGEFLLSSDFYLDGDRFSGLLKLPKAEFNRVVLRNVLSDHFGVRTQRAPQLLRCASLSTSDARLIKAAPGSAGMILETHGRDARDLPIYYQRVIIPATKRCLAIDGDRIS
jgi:GntR family transcriptional regulator